MFNRIALACFASVALWLGASAAYAHLTGAFAEYLASVYDESTTTKLKEEMNATRRQISEMTPELERLENDFSEQRDSALETLLYYKDIGPDVWMGMLQQSSTATDLLGNQWLIERHLDAYMEDLDALYLQYLQLLTTRDVLEGHRGLLVVIEENLALRQPFLDSVAGFELEQKANFLDIDWASEVEDDLVAALKADAATVAAGWKEWLGGSRLDGRLEMTEMWLNERSPLTYHFRSDHIYTVFKKPGTNVILTSQVLQNKGGDALLMIEGAFYNGFFVPEKALKELEGFVIPYEELRKFVGAGNRAYLTQDSGRLVVK